MDNNIIYTINGKNNRIIILCLKVLILSVFILNIFLTYIYKNLFINDYQLKNNFINFKNIIYINEIIKNFTNNNNINMRIMYINYYFSFKYNIVKFEYRFGFFTNNEKLIFPSDLTLFNKLHLICYVKDLNNIKIYSLPNIYKNELYNCIEYFNLEESVNFGIHILNDEEYNKTYSINFFNNKGINYNNLSYKNDIIFDPLIINNEYKLLFQQIIDNKNESLYLKNSYIQQPNFSTKKNSIIEIDFWYFINIYNQYFCLCKGYNCLYIDINQKCKYNFYLNIIDINRNLYKKNEYLLSDFIYAVYSSDDIFPVFQKMIRLNMSSHYLTEKKNIYKEYCNNNKYCKSVILVNYKNRVINGNFLEKYLELFLKLKAAITGAEFLFINNLFYNIDYIKHISVGHGVSILKPFLYSGHSYYGHKKYNKILLPPSDKIISIAKKHGWTENNIIKINLPRWDKYLKHSDTFYHLNSQKEIKKNSIFIMFTWRQTKIINKLKMKISKYYLNNIYNLINNNNLKEALVKNNITLYFTLHHLLHHLKKLFEKNKNIEYIYENEISEVLSKTNLLISDFSSIIFDMICRKKPYIIFIPDAKDPKIKNIYINNYYDIIQSIKNFSLGFENVFLDVNETVDKIVYYINNNFLLDKKLKKFYKSFGFKYGNNIDIFIEYLKQLN